MSSTETRTILTEYIDNFNTDYSPYLEWLVTSAYVLGTLTDKPLEALEYVLLSEEEQEVIKALIEELAIFQNRPRYLFEYAFEVSDAVANKCEESIHNIVREMTEYHESVFKKIEQFYNYGFFGAFTSLGDEMCTKFAELIWGTDTPKSAAFASHLIRDYFFKHSVAMPPLGEKEEKENYSSTEIKWIVIGDLLEYFSKPPGAAWLKDEDHPIKSTVKCAHLGPVIQSGKSYLCADCGDLVVDTLWDDDSFFDDTLGFGIY